VSQITLLLVKAVDVGASAALQQSKTLTMRSHTLEELKRLLYGKNASSYFCDEIRERVCIAHELGGIGGVVEFCQARLKLQIDNANTVTHLNRCMDLGYTVIGKVMLRNRVDAKRREEYLKVRRQMLPALIRERQEQRLIDEAAKTAHVRRHINAA